MIAPESILSGAQHIASDGADQIGYDRMLGAADVYHTGAEELAASFLEEQPTQPFFLSVGFHETHRTFPEPSGRHNPAYVRPPDPLPDTAETRHDTAAYLTMVEILDRKMGVVLSALERCGLANNTIVICTTDHGIAFPKMKCSLTHHGLGVMLMMRGPGIRAGAVCDGLVSHVDVFPTLCDLLQIEPPEWLQGTSFRETLLNGAEPRRETVFAEVNVHATFEPMRSARTKRWSYIRRYFGRGRPAMPNCDDGPSKAYLRANGWPENTPFAEEMLFDLLNDPHECNNLAERKDFADPLNEMRRRLGAHMRETGDSLRAGKLDIPEGARIDHPDAEGPGLEGTLSLRDYLTAEGIG